MSEMFPDLPAYRHIPEVRVTGKEAVVGACLGSALWWACPKFEAHHDHAPHQEQTEVPRDMNIAVSTGGGTSEVVPPMFFKRATRNVPGVFPGFTSRR